ncbi:hypothetical protein B484DRAFT_451616, partial [Ochromonadaceae sp. CCMP2298]
MEFTEPEGPQGVLKLNVGGCKFMTSYSTLHNIPHNMLSVDLPRGEMVEVEREARFYGLEGALKATYKVAKMLDRMELAFSSFSDHYYFAFRNDSGLWVAWTNFDLTPEPSTHGEGDELQQQAQAQSIQLQLQAQMDMQNHMHMQLEQDEPTIPLNAAMYGGAVAGAGAGAGAVLTAGTTGGGAMGAMGTAGTGT